MIRVANFGGGVNSAAGLLMDPDYDEVLYADLGSEWPETNKFINYFEKKTGIKITRVKPKEGNIFNYYWDKKVYPTPTLRDCTRKFKIRTLRRYLRNKYGKKETFETNLFIDMSEFHRARWKSDRKYEILRYPLIEAGIDREGCIELIKSKGLEPPIKSGCFFCPFNNKAQWIKLRDTHPKLWQKSLDLEKRGITKRPLISMKGKENNSLFQCGCYN